MKAFGRSAFRLFKKHIVRLITIAAIITVSVSFMAGIGEVEDRIKIAADKYYASQNISDFYIKSTNTNLLNLGFSAAELSYLNDYFNGNVTRSFSSENKYDEYGIVREYIFDFADIKVNKLQLIDGRLPSASNEILSERATAKTKGFEIGSMVTINRPFSLQTDTYTVVGTVLNPLLIYELEETSFVYENEYLDYVIYFNDVPQAVNDVYAAYGNRTQFKSFSKNYDKSVKATAAELESQLSGHAKVLTLYQNIGLYSLISYAEKVGIIAIIFVVFFLLVTMLVVYSNMNRLFDEERGQIACMKTLGYSDFAIVSRYTLFVFIGTIIGGLLSAPLSLGLTAIVYKAFNMQYAMPPFPGISKFGYFGLTFGIIAVTTLLLTYFTGMKIIGNKPVTLLSRKAPKSGKKVLLEHIGFIWNKLSFKHKSTMRNVLLFKSRFFMTVISIIGSTVLVLAGFGLADCARKMENASSILIISVMLIIFSGLLCALVIYNLTSINVSERNREIATLMVLGYNDREVCGYIFREIYVMSFIGAVLGVPLGLGFIYFVFNLINFGSIGDINWWTWIIAPAVTMLFAFLSTLLLRRKITKTDMNASLKTLE